MLQGENLYSLRACVNNAGFAHVTLVLRTKA